MKIVEDFTKPELFKRLEADTSCCNKCKTKGEDLWWMSEFDEYWCSDCRDEYIGDVEEKELTKCKCHDEQILIDYKTLVKADRMLFMVGEHGSVVLDDELRQQMIKCAADIRKCYMNMKGE